jgi:hypothetical protein
LDTLNLARCTKVSNEGLKVSVRTSSRPEPKPVLRAGLQHLTEGRTKQALRTLNVSLCYNVTDEGVAQVLRCPKLQVTSNSSFCVLLRFLARAGLLVC